jgi:hypothetical protein
MLIRFLIWYSRSKQMAVSADIEDIYFEHEGCFQCPRSSLCGCYVPTFSMEDRVDEAMLCVSSFNFHYGWNMAGTLHGPARPEACWWVAWDADTAYFSSLAACFESAIHVGENLPLNPFAGSPPSLSPRIVPLTATPSLTSALSMKAQ